MEREKGVPVKRSRIKMTSAIGEWMKLRGWTQKDFAEVIGCDRSYLSQVLSGKKTFSLSFLEKVCIHTGLEIGNLVEVARGVEGGAGAPVKGVD